MIIDITEEMALVLFMEPEDVRKYYTVEGASLIEVYVIDEYTKKHCFQYDGKYFARLVFHTICDNSAFPMKNYYRIGLTPEIYEQKIFSVESICKFAETPPYTHIVTSFSQALIVESI